MSAAATTSAIQPAAAAAEMPTHSGRLLALLRKLIDYGKELVGSIRQRAAADPSITAPFGTADIALILARIARGLQLAVALEVRVANSAASLDAGLKPPRLRPPRTTPAARPTDAAAPRLPDLPTPEQIAAAVRRRPLGAVLADICRDFGIKPCHPLWRELHWAIIRYSGNLARLLSDMMDRTLGPVPRIGPTPRPGPTPRFAVPSGTDPP